MRASLLKGATDVDALQKLALNQLQSGGWVVDYIVVRRQRDLLPPSKEEIEQNEPLVILAAAKLGQTRLIDNLEV
jgi:pantoate--beta-alanine ligase